MKKIILVLALFVASKVHAQEILKLKPINLKKMSVVTAQLNTTSKLKAAAIFKSADPLQKSFMIANTKKSASTKPAETIAASNLTITSADRKTTKKIVKVLPLEGNKQTDLGNETNATTVASDGSKTICTTKKIRMEAGYSDNNLLSPMEEIMWVGNILDGNTILNGGYGNLNTISTADRNTYPVSIDLNAGAEQPLTATIGSNGFFGRGKFNEAINTVKNQGITLEQTGEGGFSYSEVFSNNQVYANLSAGITVTPASLTSNIGLVASSNSTKTNYIVQFYEIWYTATLDIPTWELVKDLSKVNNEALVISSIKYGRMGTFLFESTADIDSLNLYLQAAFNVNPSVAVNTLNNAGFNNVHRNTTIKSFVNGANGVATNLVDFLRFVTEKQWTAASAAQPIGYTLRFVKDGQIANVLTTTEFNQRTCDVIPPPGKTNIKFTIGNITPTKDIEAWGEDICGKITLYAYYKDENNKEVKIAENTIWNVGCSPSSWMAGVDEDDPVVVDKSKTFVYEANQIKKGFLRVTLDIRDGLEGKNQAGLNEWNSTSQQNRDRGFVQYNKFTEDYDLANLKQDDAVSINGHFKTLQEMGGTPKLTVSFTIKKSEIK